MMVKRGPRAGCAGLGCLAALMAVALTGCQVDVGGQTLPSPYWQSDDVQYFPPGHEFKLQREASAMQRDNAPAPQPAPQAQLPASKYVTPR